jgi:hypothetical protein
LGALAKLPRVIISFIRCPLACSMFHVRTLNG